MSLKKPNPNYVGREHVESIIEGTGAELIELVMRGDDLDINDALVREAVDHVKRGYGSIRAEGERGGDQTVFRNQTEVAPEVVVPADPQTGEAPFESLAREARARR